MRIWNLILRKDALVSIMNEIKIYPVLQEDQEKVVSFFAKLGPEGTFFFNRLNGNCKRALKAAAGEIPYYHGFMAVDHEEMVGYVFLYDMNKGIPVLGIGAIEGYKGVGLGSKMMEYAIAHAKKHGKGGIC